MALSQAFRDKVKAGLKNGFGRSGGSGKYLKLDNGEKKTTRMVPAEEGLDPIVCGEVHYNITDDGPIPCPGRGCPVNQALWSIKESGRADAGDLFKAFGAKPQAAWIVVDRADPELTPQIVSKGFSVKKKNGAADQMMSMFIDEASGADVDPSHPENGFDVVMEKSGDGMAYTLKAARSNSPLAPSAEKRADIIQKAKALNLHNEFVVTDAHLKLLHEAAEKILDGKLKAKSRFNDKPRNGEQEADNSGAVDTMALAEQSQTSESAPAPAATTTAPTPSASPAQSLKDKIQAKANAQKAA